MSKRLTDVKWDPVNMEFRLDIDHATAIVGPTDDGVYESYLQLLPIIESNRNGAYDNGFSEVQDCFGFNTQPKGTESLRDGVH